MRHHPILPSLRDDGAVANFNEAGTWQRRNPAELERISQSLRVMNAGAADSEIDSIPNMWARPLLFEMALYDADHPLHKRILGEWRGLLAMLALKEWRDFPLTVEPIEIPTEDDSAAPEFLRALRKLLPIHTLHTEATWDRIHIILFKGKTIGLTSPTTFVCTAVNYIGCISRVSWFDEQFLFDPITELSTEEKQAVAGWLRNLHATEIDSLPNLDHGFALAFRNRVEDIAAALKGLIFDFMDDLDVDNQNRVTLSSNGLGLTQTIFRGMDKPVAARDLPPSVMLVPSSTKSPQTSLLVVDETIAEDWEVDPQDVVVWGIKTLATYRSFGGELPLLPPDVHLREPKDFFTEKLFVIDQQNAFHAALLPEGSDQLNFQGGPVTPILPLTDELLSYLDVNDLNRRITFEERDTGIVVKLQLTLTGIDEQSRDFILSQEYQFQNEEVSLISDVPILEIWPNFKKSDWGIYYTYFTTYGQNTFHAKPFVLANETSNPRSFPNSRGNIEKEITQTSCVPEAMLCEYQDNRAGLLLIVIPEALPDGEKTWTVGVDFGTTSTTVYRNDQQNDPQRVAFDTHLLQVTESGSGRNLLYDDFLPDKPESTPFLSLFQDFGPLEGQKLKALLDGHIYFLDNYRAFHSAGNIVTNLKWSAEPIDRIRTQAFLEQLCLQCAAEAVVEGAREINWRFSFPIAFSRADTEQFRNIWDQVINTCTATTGLQQGSVRTEPESIVSAKFFASTGPFATGAVCIDIGGETSDISIWQQNKLYCQTSLRFAGRHIFLDRLKKNPGFLRNFDVSSEDIQLLENASNFYAQADVLIKANEQGQRWLNQLSLTAGRSQVKTFVQLIAIGTAGLLYYVGLVLRYLGENTSFERRMPSVYIGGNGSRILHWLANGEFGPDSASKELLKQVLRDASGFSYDDFFDLVISKYPKEEAAFGLVNEEIILESNEVQLEEILAGEAFIEDETECRWTEILTAERLVRGFSTHQRLEQIENFVKSFNANTGRGQAIEMPIELAEVDSNLIFERLQNQLLNFRGTDPQNLHIEPLFILALKLLLERKTEQWK